MFQTHPEAESPLLSGTATLGGCSWRWVELALQIPYFLMYVNMETEEGPIGCNYIFSQLKDAMNLITSSGDSIKEMEIGLLSPAYMNGSSSYQLGQVKEIWQCRSGYEKKFVMKDGSTLFFPSEQGNMMNHEMELVVSL